MILCFGIGLVSPPAALAETVPMALSISGALFNPDGSIVSKASVDFHLEVWDAAGTCKLYSEDHPAQDLKVMGGHFSLALGMGTNSVNAIGSSNALTAAVFANPGTIPAFAGCANPPTLNPGDSRLIRISYNLGAGFTSFSPDVPILSSAYAMVAETLQGKAPGDFIQVGASGSSALTQVNTEYAFSASNWPRLKALLDGTSAQYAPAVPMAPVDTHAQRLINVANPIAAQDAATKNYVDTNFAGKPVDTTATGPMLGNGLAVVWDATANRWTTGTITATGAAGGDLSGSYPNPRLADGAVIASKISVLGQGINRLVISDATTGSTLGFAVCAQDQILRFDDTLGWICASVSSLSPVTSVAGKFGAVTLNANDVGGLGTAALKDYGTAAGEVVALDASARLPAVDGSRLTGVRASGLGGFDIASVTPSAGQVLGFNGTAWVPVATTGGTVTQVTAGAGLLPTTITSTGTLAVNLGTSAGQVIGLDGAARIPAVDGSLLSNVRASALGSIAIASIAPTSGQVLGFNGTAWIPVATTGGTVTQVTAGAGLVPGTITSTGTLAVNLGTNAGQVIALDNSARLPAVDASQLNNVDAVMIAGRQVASALPTADQVLTWNQSTTQWEPRTAATGSVQSVAAGAGLLGGPITTSGTLSVDTGTTALKIVQLNGTAQIPAVDGSLLLGVNATKIATRAVASSAPTTGQVLTWNGSTNQWEPAAVTAGTITSLQTGTGLSGGPITATGTISLANTSVSAGTYGTASSSPSFTVDAQGRLTASSNVAIALDTAALTSGTLAAARLPAFTGDVTSSAGATALTLSASGVTAGTYGKVTVDSKGRVTAGQALQAADVTTALGFTPVNKAGDTGLGSLDFTGGNYVRFGQANQSDGNDGKIGAALFGDGLNIVGVQTVAGAGRKITTYGTLVSNGAVTVGGDVDITGTYRVNGVPLAAGGGTVTSVGAGNGLLGGPITASGALAVDVGVTALKIPQLDASGRYPAATGFVTTARDNISNRVDSGFYQTSAATTANGWPVTSNSWYHLLSSTHTNDGNYYAMQFAGNFYDSNELYYRATAGNGAAAWAKVWTSGSLTNLNQLTNGPGYITSVTGALGYTPVNRAGDTMTGVLNASAGVTSPGLVLSGSDPYLKQSADNAHVVLSGGSGYTSTGAAVILRGVSDSSNSGGIDIVAATSGTRQLNIAGFTGVNVSGTLSATAFSGDGAALTNVTASSVAWNAVTGKPFNYAGQSGQPSWLWGTNDGTNYYVWNPSNFTVSNVTALAGTWDGVSYFRSNKGSTSTIGANSAYALEAYSSDGGAAAMSFHRAGNYAVNLGLDPDNVFRIGGWSASANRWQLDMSGNQTVAGTSTATQFNGSGAGLTGSAPNLTVGTASALNSSGDNVSTTGWYRSNGNVGWYNNTYGGGLFMQDSTWIRTYGSKNLYVQNGALAVDGSVTAPSLTSPDSSTTLKIVSKTDTAGPGSVYLNSPAGPMFEAAPLGASPTSWIRVQPGNASSPAQIQAINSNASQTLVLNPSGGTVGIGTTAPNGTLDVVGGPGPVRMRNNAYSVGWTTGPDTQNNFVVYYNLTTGVYMPPGATGWSGNSDRRLKKDFAPLEDALPKLQQITGLTYRYKTDADSDPRRVGVIAQDVQKVLPEAVSERDGFLGVRYTELIPLVINAVKELYDKWSTDHQELRRLAAENEELKQRLKAIEDRLPAR